MDVRYDEAAPLRTTPCLAWLIEAGKRKFIFISGVDLTVEGVIEQFGRTWRGGVFTVQNITVGTWHTGGQSSDAYFNDARSVTSEGMVEL